MMKKYINRKKQNISSEDEWNSIEELNQNLEIQDVPVVTDRTIFFNSEPEKKQTHWEKTKDATRNAMDRAGNTSQYMKYVNAHLEKQNSEIERIKKLAKKFDQEIDLLANNKRNFKNTESNNLEKQNLQNQKDSLLKEKILTREYLNQLKNKVLKTEKNLQNLDEQLEDVESHLVD